MRIALVHSFYRSDVPSGENVVVRRQVEALLNAGHEVELVARHTDNESRSRTYPLRSAMSVATGYGPDPTQELAAFRPEIVHVHNLFPNFGTRWLADWQGPLVATLHNFRPLCANGLLFRDGRVCTDCIGGNSFNAVKHACYRGSRIASAPLALRNRGGLARNPLVQRAERVIVLSERSRAVYVAADPDLESRLEVLPNGLEDRTTGSRQDTRSGWVFIGRVSEEKGLRELLRSWPKGEQLTVAGDGPMREELQASAPPSVRWLGAVDPQRVDQLLKESLGLVFPSRCFEGAPVVLIEALMNGAPVVALAGSAAADLAEEQGCGRVYGDAVGLTAALAQVKSAGESLRSDARMTYESNFTVRAWVRRLESVYRRVADSGSAS